MSLRAFLDNFSPESEIRRLMTTEEGFDRGVWRRLSEDLGVPGLLIPERFGGSGGNFTDIAVFLEEAGRSLLCAPVLSSAVIATSALVMCGDDAAKNDYLPALSSGQIRATMMLCGDPRGCWTERQVAVEAVESAGTWKLSGLAGYVIDGATADLLLTPARTPGGIALFVIDATQTAIKRTALTTLDATRKMAAVEFDSVPARPISGADWSLIERTQQIASIALAIEQVGGMQKLLDLAVAHAQVREQFGRPIGSFQAVKHICAQMLLEVESARAAAYYAAGAVIEQASDLAEAASVAKAFCSTSYINCANAAIQVLGGIGVTWDHPAHLYFRRATSSMLLFGDPETHREYILTANGI